MSDPRQLGWFGKFVVGLLSTAISTPIHRFAYGSPKPLGLAHFPKIPGPPCPAPQLSANKKLCPGVVAVLSTPLQICVPASLTQPAYSSRLAAVSPLVPLPSLRLWHRPTTARGIACGVR